MTSLKTAALNHCLCISDKAKVIRKRSYRENVLPGACASLPFPIDLTVIVHALFALPCTIAYATLTRTPWQRMPPFKVINAAFFHSIRVCTLRNFWLRGGFGVFNFSGTWGWVLMRVDCLKSGIFYHKFALFVDRNVTMENSLGQLES